MDTADKKLPDPKDPRVMEIFKTSRKLAKVAHAFSLGLWAEWIFRAYEDLIKAVIAGSPEVTTSFVAAMYDSAGDAVLAAPHAVFSALADVGDKMDGTEDQEAVTKLVMEMYMNAAIKFLKDPDPKMGKHMFVRSASTALFTSIALGRETAPAAWGKYGPDGSEIPKVTGNGIAQPGKVTLT